MVGDGEVMMQYDMRRPTTEAEAIAIIDDAQRVIWEQIEFYRGVRKRGWNGEFVDHLRKEATHAIAFLADRHPKQLSVN
jgi:hypothetical protein